MKHYLKAKHIFKSCNIYLKPERFCKSKFQNSLNTVLSGKFVEGFQIK